MLKIELTPEEANSVLHLVDLAVKYGGVAAAKVGVPIFDKILGAAKDAGLIPPPDAEASKGA